MEDFFIEIGTRQVWGGSFPVGLSRDDRLRHAFVIGKTGTGKSTLLRNLIVQSIAAGEGVGFIDPHGDLAKELLDLIPPHRVSDVLLFDAADFEFPVAFNLFQPVERRRRHLVTSSIVSAFKGAWSENWGPRTEWIVSGCVSALLECENVSLLGVPRLLTDPVYREWVLKRVTDPGVLAFWKEVASYDRRFFSEVIAPVQNKVGALLLSAGIRNILGQVRNRLDVRAIMDQRRILIVNLSKGLVGEDKANLLGALLVSAFKSAALSRADQPEHRRAPFLLHIDEFHSFGTDAYCSILSETRKYGLGLVLSTQHLHQVSEDVRQAVFGNCGSVIAFRTSESDATVLAREFGSGLEPALFANLANFEVCAKLLQEGRHGSPFLAKTNPPSGRRHGRGQNIVRRSRRWHATPRAIVEERIRRWTRSSPWTFT